MVTYLNKSIVYGINSYLKKLLEVNLDWEDETFTNSLGETFKSSRIIPASQQPELINSGKPFIVYGSTIRSSGHLYALKIETIAYTVYSTSVTEVDKIIGLIDEALTRQDDSAVDLNNWFDLEGETNNRPGGSRDLSVLSTKVVMAQKAEASESEGGYSSGTVMLECRYVVGDSGIETSFVTY